MLEVYEAMAALKAARAKPRREVTYRDEDGDEDDDDQDGDDVRTIVGEIETDDEPEPAPLREVTRQPEVMTTVADDAELRRMARNRGGLGGSRAYYGSGS